VLGDTGLNEEYISPQLVEVSGVRVSTSADRDVEHEPGTKRGKQLGTHQLAQPTLEPVAIHRSMLMARNDDSNSRKCERGSEDTHIEVCGPNSLPLAKNGLYVEASRQSIATRKAKTLATPLRTCSGA